MKIFKKGLVIFICIMLMVACGKKERVFLEKDGTLYKISDQVTFYYPKDFKVDTSYEDKNQIRFISDKQTYSFSIAIKHIENKLTEMPRLYAGQLEEDGAVDVKYNDVTLGIGIQCQAFTGMYQSSGINFKHIVYFTTGATYDYFYEAVQEVYDENISIVNQFLESLTVHHEHVTTLE